MGIKAVLDAEAYEGLEDESVKGLYAKAKDGRYVLDAEGVDDLPQVRGLVTTLNKYKEADPDANRLKRRLESLSKWEPLADRDPEEVQAALEKLADLEAKAANGKDEDGDDVVPKAVLEKRTKALEDKYTNELEQRDTEIQTRDQFIEKLLIDNVLDATLSTVGESGVIPETRRAVKALLKADYGPRVVRDGEEYKAIVSTDMGDQPLADFVEAWAKTDDADPYMPASGNRGSGATGGSGVPRGGKNPFTKEHWNMTEQGRLVEDKPEQARQLILAAGKDPKKFDL